jgi:hypothetical protein
MSRDASIRGVGGIASKKTEVEVNQFELSPTEPSQGPTEDASPGCIQLCMEMTKKENLAVFRMFEDLNMLNLLTLQAELTKLRSEFIKVASGNMWEGGYYPWQIIDSDGHPADFSKLYESNAGKELQERHLQIRGKLKEYSKCSNKKLGMPFNNSF